MYRSPDPEDRGEDEPERNAGEEEGDPGRLERAAAPGIEAGPERERPEPARGEAEEEEGPEEGEELREGQGEHGNPDRAATFALRQAQGERTSYFSPFAVTPRRARGERTSFSECSW